MPLLTHPPQILSPLPSPQALLALLACGYGLQLLSVPLALPPPLMNAPAHPLPSAHLA